MQSSEEKSQNAREMVSGRDEDYKTTEGLRTTFGDTQRSAYTRHHKEDSSEGNGSHMGICVYDNTPYFDDEKCHSPNLSSSPDLFVQMHDDEAPNINYRPCDSNKAILYATTSDSDDYFIIKKATSDKHSSRPTQLTATTPDMSLQISSRRYDRPRNKNSPQEVKARNHSPDKSLSKLMVNPFSDQQHDKQMQSLERGYVAENSSSLKCVYLRLALSCEYPLDFIMKTHSTGDSEEDLRYKKITTEGHLPHPNRPRAPPPPDHLDQ